MRLNGKNIIVGVTGGIAAYKTATLIRLLKKEGAEVKVVMTPPAKQFITPLTLATLSGNPVMTDFFNPENGEWNSHVSLGEWGDAYVIAPATANTLAKMAHGIADNLLLTIYLSARCPVVAAPAMDLDMYAHAATQANLTTLVERGVTMVEPGEGFLASGLEGKGRMAEPEQICEAVCALFGAASRPLAGKKALVTVGGTVEHIDEVRYITNHSTGKMGYAMAAALEARGADVTIIRASVDPSLIGSIFAAEEKEALSADAMYNEVMKLAPQSDILVMAAAVADFSPETVKKKIKKSEKLTLDLFQTKDIAAEVGKNKREGQVLIGFALESDDGRASAIEKMERKNLNCIVLNSLSDAGAGFGHDTNKVTLFSRSGEVTDFPLKDKKELAKEIIDTIFAV